MGTTTIICNFLENQLNIQVKEGGSLPVTGMVTSIFRSRNQAFLEKQFGCSALHLPLGTAMDRAHLQNERIKVENLLKGKNVLKRLFKELSNTTHVS